MEIVGIVTALRMEASCVSSMRMPFKRIVRLSATSVVWLSGMGYSAARLAAKALLEQGATALVSFGVAGALDPKLRPGDLVLPKFIHSGEISQQPERESLVYSVSLDWRLRLQQLLPPSMSITDNTLTSSPGVLTTKKDKLELAAVTGACAVDMESFAIAEVAHQAGVPFIAIRAIVDPVKFSPPSALLHIIQPEGSVKMIPLLLLLLQRSVGIGTLIRLRKEIHAAQSSLAAVVCHANKELGCMAHKAL